MADFPWNNLKIQQKFHYSPQLFPVSRRKLEVVKVFSIILSHAFLY